MRFLVDAQLSPEVAVWLRSNGHDAEHVNDVLGPRSGDREIVARARATSAVIVSKDRDFVGLLDGECSPQFLWVRVGNALNRVLLARLAAAWPRISSELAAGTAVVELT